MQNFQLSMQPICRKSSIVILGFLVLFGVVQHTQAATISFSPFGTDHGYRVDVLLDPQKQDINALEGVLRVTGLSSDVSLEDGNSIVTLWTERPNSKTNVDAHEITFSGIIPVGFSGVLSSSYAGSKPGLLFSIFIPQTETGVVRIETASGKVYLNDGQGTALELPAARIRFSPASVTGSIRETEDTTAPEPFAIEIGRDETIYSNKWFASFEARDTDSGIDHYELRELKGNNGSWRIVESPALLDDQSLTSAIEVRAIDHAGNVRLAHLDASRKSSFVIEYSEIIAAFLLLLALGFFLNREKTLDIPRP